VQDRRQATRLVSASERASSTTCKPATVAREGKMLFSRSYRRRVSSYLSGGEQQMVAIWRMLMSDPKVMLLDEPSVALSPVAVGIMVDALLKLRQRGASLLLVEQRIDVAVRVCDRLYVMTHGAIVDE
jgi:branched-chain amino acid transport system ATP-binding protein